MRNADGSASDRKRKQHDRAGGERYTTPATRQCSGRSSDGGRARPRFRAASQRRAFSG
jgi:hypothetical protein